MSLKCGLYLCFQGHIMFYYGLMLRLHLSLSTPTVWTLKIQANTKIHFSSTCVCMCLSVYVNSVLPVHAMIVKSMSFESCPKHHRKIWSLFREREKHGERRETVRPNCHSDVGSKIHELCLWCIPEKKSPVLRTKHSLGHNRGAMV